MSDFTKHNPGNKPLFKHISTSPNRKNPNPGVWVKSPNPYYKTNPNEPYSDFAFVLLIPLIIAAVGAGATIASSAINASKAKKAAQAQQQLLETQAAAQIELKKIQEETEKAVQEQKAKQSQQYMIYGIIALIVIAVAFFMIKKKT